MTQPASIPADGSLKVAWVPAIANTSAPTVAELTAGGVVDLSLYLTGEGFTPAIDEQEIPDERLASRQTFERAGRFKMSLNISYVHNPASAPNNLAYTTLTHKTLGFVVARWGIPFETGFLATQKVDVMPAECGKRLKSPPTANSVLTVAQRIFLTGTTTEDVAVV